MHICVQTKHHTLNKGSSVTVMQTQGQAPDTGLLHHCECVSVGRTFESQKVCITAKYLHIQVFNTFSGSIWKVGQEMRNGVYCSICISAL